MREQLKKEAQAAAAIKRNNLCDAVLADLIARQDAYIDGLGWQPIESAPKNVYIMLGNEDYVEKGYLASGEVLVCNNGDYTEGGYGRDYECKDDCYAEYNKPTHWMPLLVVPKQLTKREA